MKVIAETAFNHNGSLEYLKSLIRVAADSGSDYATGQIMEAKSFCVAEYERFGIYTETEFSQSDWRQIFQLCDDLKIEFIPCALEEASFEFCYSEGFR